MKYFALLLLLSFNSLRAISATIKIRAVVPSSMEIQKKYFDYPSNAINQSAKNEANKNIEVKKQADGSYIVTIATNQ